MNIVYGLYSPDSGSIFVGRRPVDISSPQDVVALGIGMVHQHSMPVPDMTVAEKSRACRADRPSAIEHCPLALLGAEASPDYSVLHGFGCPIQDDTSMNTPCPFSRRWGSKPTRF
jgi:hypothetical protein